MKIVIGRLKGNPVMNPDESVRFTIVSNDNEQNKFVSTITVAPKQGKLIMKYLKKRMLICIDADFDKQWLVIKRTN